MRVQSQNATQYLQLGLCIGCNSNHCSVAIEKVQYQAETLSICNSERVIFIFFYQTNCNSTRTPVATRQALQLQLLKHFSCNSERVTLIIFIR
jgi:hypothetical protein